MEWWLGVLRARFTIIKKLVGCWKINNLDNIVAKCIIL
jgi:hypothetical protein